MPRPNSMDFTRLSRAGMSADRPASMRSVAESIAGRSLVSSERVTGRGAFRALIALWAGAAVLVVLVVVAHRVLGRPYGDFTRDPDAVADAPFYVGALSLFGLIAWGAGAAAGGLAAAVLWTVPPRRAVLSLAFLSVFTLYLATDDAYQLHESVFPSDLGIPQDAIYAAYVLVAAAYLVLAHSVIFRTQWWLLGAALVAFAVSIGLDVLIESRGLPILAEDSAKLFGILAWGLYIAHTAFVELRASGRPAG